MDVCCTVFLAGRGVQVTAVYCRDEGGVLSRVSRTEAPGFMMETLGDLVIDRNAW